ncbi:MAG: SDR family NAD(P)-dependent oxidoreductase [Exilibacterium sp.]
MSEWHRPRLPTGRDSELREYPRRAGLSSFGAGGANAHVLIEEYIAPSERQPRAVVADSDQKTLRLITLSARNAEQLTALAVRLHDYLRERTGAGEVIADAELTDIAYTLQVGREAMDERLAMAVDNAGQLLENLAAFIEGREDIDGCHRGRVKRHKETLAAFNADEDMEYTLAAWISKRKYTRLLELWVKGLVFDWHRLYDGGRRPRRVSLPSYPFARQRFWPAAAGPVAAAESAADLSRLHPLLHRNTSDFSQQRFTSVFSGEEFFLDDHRIQGRRILPGVACLEMVRAALAQTLRRNAGDYGLAFEIKDIVWLYPLVVEDGKPAEIHIALSPRAVSPELEAVSPGSEAVSPGSEARGEVDFEIYSESQNREDTAAEPLVHCTGKCILHAGGNAGPVEKLDIDALDRECGHQNLSAEQCYRDFAAMGIDYGPAHRAIQSLQVGAGQVLAKLSLPEVLSDSRDRFGLHPSLLDGALQASVGLLSPGGPQRPIVPFALGSLAILTPGKPVAWAWVRRADSRLKDSRGNGKGNSTSIETFDIDLCDARGEVCLRLRGLVCRRLDRDNPGHGEERKNASQTLLLYPQWKEQPIGPAGAANSFQQAQRWVILCDADPGAEQATIEQKIAFWLRNEKPEDQAPQNVVCLKSPHKAVENRFQDMALQLFGIVKNILTARPKTDVIIQLVIFSHGRAQVYTALSGLLKTAAQENPRLIGQSIEVDSPPPPAVLAQWLRENAAAAKAGQVHYRGDRRFAVNWQVAEGPRIEHTGRPWKDGGVYLISGGCGGLGLILAREIALGAAAGVTLILTGRSRLDERQRARLKTLEDMGARVDYRELDVADKVAVVQTVRNLVDRFGHFNGIIHCAGVTRDSFIINKTAAEIEVVLAPKVKGVVNLDQATRDHPLDLFMLFSSVAGALGNAGQADYAAANAFLDHFAEYRNSLVSERRRSGRTLSINWPLWRDGGMQVDPETEKMLQQTTGLVPLETGAAIETLYRAWFQPAHSRMMVLAGDVGRIENRLLGSLQREESKSLQREEVKSLQREETKKQQMPMRKRVQNRLIQMVCDFLKAQPEDIHPDEELSAYGFDSVTLTGFAGQLNRDYRLALTPTIFFEYPTLRKFAAYLVEEHAEAFAEPASANPPAGEAPAPAPRLAMETAPGSRRAQCRAPAGDALPRTNRFAARGWLSPQSGEGAGKETVGRPEGTERAVAIIGISARFPGAGDIDAYWQNLLAGRDCITEIPGWRWDWRALSPRLRAFDEVPLVGAREETHVSAIKWGGFIDGVDRFDPLFFGISPNEARLMDPQQRLLMTHAWKAIEDAGYAPQSLSGTRTGIFVGTATSAYNDLVLRSPEAIEGYTATGSLASVGPNRMSYFLNLHGPSEPVETACSSSLVAIHRALGAMEHIYGLIRASAENHGGRANSLTAPNPKAQAELLRTAYRKAGVEPDSVGYIEAHGTGTELGDPIEINALKSAFADLYREAGLESGGGAPHCGLGSVKSNVGHLELAAGVAGVIKVLLQFRHRTLVRSLHCERLNPYIDLQGSPFYVVRENREWRRLKDARGREWPRRAGVSSFGFGGVNAHVVLEEFSPGLYEESSTGLYEESSTGLYEESSTGLYEESSAGLYGKSSTAAAPLPRIIVLSARSGERLKASAANLAAFLSERRADMEGELDSIAYTLQVGREPMAFRLALVVESVRELEAGLKAFLEDRQDLENLYWGEAGRDKETLDAFTVDGASGDEPVYSPHDVHIREALEEGAGAQRPQGTFHTLPAEFLIRLSELWVRGLVVDWDKFYGGVRLRRISLPTYPFAEERYWIEPTAGIYQEPSAEVYGEPSAEVMERLQRRYIKSLQRKFMESPRQALIESFRRNLINSHQQNLMG